MDCSNSEIRKLIEKISLNSRDYSDFFPEGRVSMVEGRFELLAMSILDVNRYNADRLWYVVGPRLRTNGALRKEHLKTSDVGGIADELIEAGYNRGPNYTREFANKLKKLAVEIDRPPFNGDVSNLFNSFQEHNSQTIMAIRGELVKLSGVGQKVATMFIKIMLSDLGEWTWRGPENSLMDVAPPIDSQVRKVYIRLGNEISGNFETDLQALCERIGVSFIKLDDVFWNVGRIFCKSKINPNCCYCSLKSSCEYAKQRRKSNIQRRQELDELVEQYT